MQVLVTVKEVAELTDDVVVDGTDVAEDSIEYGLNEWDEYAIEAAVQLAEVREEVEVVTVTIGPERSEETIRMALAKGADRAIRIWDDSLVGGPLLDTRVRSALLSAVVEREDPDLVLTGVQSGDAMFGSTGVALAEAVDYGWAAVVNQLELREDEGIAAVHRELEGGLEELSEVELPAVLTIQTGINEPRYASLRGIRQAQSKELERLDPDALGVDASDLEGALSVTAMYEPEGGGDTAIWEGAPEETAGKLAELLRETGVIEA